MASAAACVTAEATCMAEAAYVADSAGVTDSVSHFIASEMVNVVETLRRVGAIAMIWHRTAISVMNIEMVVHVAAKVSRAVKPRAGANEDAASKPLRAVVAVGSAVVRSEVIVAIGACGFVIEPVVDQIVRVGSGRREEHSGN
jgi:predicted DNA repair protein MutK